MVLWRYDLDDLDVARTSPGLSVELPVSLA